jgi:hypothetical protein
VEQSTGGQCEMVKQTGSRSLALLRLRVVGDKGEGSARGAVSETGCGGDLAGRRAHTGSTVGKC